MNNREFMLWLWGFLEVCEPQLLSRRTLYIIRNHMNLVLAVEKKFGALNQRIYDRISDALREEAANPLLFETLKNMVSDRLQEMESQTA